MKVIATAKGFDGSTIREVGEVFVVADGTPLGKWMEPVEVAEEVEPVKPVKAKKGAATEDESVM